MIPAAGRPASSSNIDLSIIKQDSQRNLFKLLNKFEGTKTIVWDDKLIGPFEFVSSASQLKEHDANKWIRLSDHRLIFTSDRDTDYTLFFLRKNYQVAEEVAEVLQRADKESLAKTSLVFIPQRCSSIEKILELNKVDLSKLNSIEELPIEFFVLDSDVVSMENEFVYKQMYHDSDFSSVHNIVEGLTKLQNIYGQIPRISGQGKGAKLVCDLLVKRRKLNSNNSTSTRSSPQINHLILIDRRIDLISPFLTQLTYEGLLDEVFGINHGNITLPSEKFQQPDDQKSKKNAQRPEPKFKKIELKSSEELYARLRDCHINAIGEILKQSARNLQIEYDECKKEGKTIHEMRTIVKRVAHLKMAQNSQANHITIAELVKEQSLKPEFIYGVRIEHELLQEEKINRIMSEIDTKLLRQEDPLHVLQLICLQSILNNGLKPKVCEYYKREIIQNYGDDYLLLLMRLEKAHLLLGHERFYENGTFSQLKSKFNLINDCDDECNPNHMSYVYGGYSPLSVIVAKILAQFPQSYQWRSLGENLRLLPEPTVTYCDPNQQVGSNNLQSVDGNTGSRLTSSAVAAASMLLSSASGTTSAVSGATSSLVRRNSATSSQSSGEETRTVMVFFIGGCTFAEISALRFLTQQEEINCEFFIGTTKIINGRTFIKSMKHRQ